MKKFFSNIFSLSLTLGLGLSLGLTSCDDVPAPYEVNLETGTSTGDTKVSSKEEPFTVTEAIKDLSASKSGNYWVKGYIVGYLPANNSVMSAAEFCASDTASQTNLVLAPTADETATDNCMAIQLPSGDIRTALNVKSNPGNIGKEVLLYGSLEKYCGAPGLKSVSYCEIDGKSYGTEPGKETPLGEAKGTGTATDPFNIAAAIAKCKATGETATAEKYYVKGIVKSVNTSGIANYGNINVDMVDDLNNSNVFTAYQIMSFNGAKFTTDDVVKVGDTIVVLGNLVNYKGNTPETSGKGSANLVSVNGKVPEAAKPSLEAGSGTFASPYNTPRALALIKSGKATTDSVYVAGRVIGTPAVSFDANGLGTYSLQLCGIDSTKFTIQGGLALGGSKFTDEEDIMPGDSLIVYGILDATAGLSGSRIVSQNGEVAGIYTPPTPDSGETEGNLLTNSSFEEWADEKTPTDWKPASTAGNATLAQSTDAHTGSYSVQINKVSKNVRLGRKEMELTAGTYQMSFYVKSTDATNKASVRPGYVLVNKADNSVSGSYQYGNYTNDIPADWTLVNHEFTLDADQYLSLVVMLPSNSGASVVIDDFTLLKK